MSYESKASFEGAPNYSLRIARLAPDLGKLAAGTYIDLNDGVRRVAPRGRLSATVLGSSEFTDMYGDASPNPDAVLEELKEQHPDVFEDPLMSEIVGIQPLGSEEKPAVALMLDEEFAEERTAVHETISHFLGVEPALQRPRSPHITLAETDSPDTARKLIKKIENSGQYPSYVLLDPAKPTAKRR